MSTSSRLYSIGHCFPFPGPYHLLHVVFNSPLPFLNTRDHLLQALSSNAKLINSYLLRCKVPGCAPPEIVSQSSREKHQPIHSRSIFRRCPICMSVNTTMGPSSERCEIPSSRLGKGRGPPCFPCPRMKAGTSPKA